MPSFLQRINFVKKQGIKCPCCNCFFYTQEAYMYLNEPGTFLVKCPACIDNFDVKSDEEYYNA